MPRPNPDEADVAVEISPGLKEKYVGTTKINRFCQSMFQSNRLELLHKKEQKFKHVSAYGESRP